MKKLLLSVFALFFGHSLFAQCVPNLSIQGTNALIQDVVTLSPDSGRMADMAEGQPYNDVLSFVFENAGSAFGQSIAINQIQVLELTNLPDGLSVEYVSGRPADNNNDGIIASETPIFNDPSSSPNHGPFGCATISGTPTGVTQADLIPGTDSLEVLLEVRANNLITQNAPLKFRYTLISGIASDFLETINLNLFPNPATNSLTLNFTTSSTQDLTFEVIDIQGRRTNIATNGTFQPGDHTVTLDVSSLSNGLYFVKSVVGETVYSQKFIKR